ncbi:hypothetical protein G7054_g5655 [Neopestalotiopsis clavispora]|nr:hypothetical protein G7054_g5655 [Neopestalotiopsis clavispora]
MATSIDDRRRVYLACRSIFSGNDAQLRKKKAVQKKIHTCIHMSSLASLAHMNMSEIVAVARSLLERRIFESNEMARIEFPDLFQSTIVQEPSQELPELEIFQRVGGHLLNGAADSEEHDEEAHGSGDLDVPIELVTHDEVQSLLEECFYEFAQQWLPDVLEQEQCDCAMSIELNEWARLIRKHEKKIPSAALDLMGKSDMESVLAAVAQIRHSAVHRNKLTGSDVRDMVAQAAAAASMLRDTHHASVLETMANEVRYRLISMESIKKRAETQAMDKLRDINERRIALLREEDAAIAEMVRRDADGTRSMGLLIEEAVDKILRGPLEYHHGVACDEVDEDGDEDEYLDAEDAEEGSLTSTPRFVNEAEEGFEVIAGPSTYTMKGKAIA